VVESTANVAGFRPDGGCAVRFMIAPGFLSTPSGKIEPLSSNDGKVLPLPLFRRYGTAGSSSSGES
jgi:hypothetical protein